VSGLNEETAAFAVKDAASITGELAATVPGARVATGVVHVIDKVLFPRRTTLGTLAGALGWGGKAVRALAGCWAGAM